MTEQHRAQHHFLGQLTRLGLDHQDRVRSTCNHQVQIAVVVEPGLFLVEQILAVLVADTGGADRTIERQAGTGQCSGDTEQRRDLGIHRRVERHHGADDLHLVGEALGKQRTDRTVDQARSEDFLLGRTPFATEKTAGDNAGGVGLFLVIDGHGKEIALARGALLVYHGAQHHGVAHVDHHGGIGLAGYLARFHHDLVVAVLKLFSYMAHGNPQPVWSGAAISDADPVA